MPSYAVSLLSGGLDSTTVTTLAKSETDHLTALTFHYGQSHSKEVDRAADIAKCLDLPQELMDISFLGKVAWYSANWLADSQSRTLAGVMPQSSVVIS